MIGWDRDRREEEEKKKKKKKKKSNKISPRMKSGMKKRWSEREDVFVL